jgi:DNA-binding MarR family transcriptional regulator
MTAESEQILARRIIEILPTVMQVVTAELRRTQYPLVPTQLGVLTMLADHPCNLSELAEHHVVSLPTMSNIISKMVAQGWVARTRAEHDRRMLLIEITAVGRGVWLEIGRQIISRITELLTPLSADEREALLTGLVLLQTAFAVMPQPFPIEFED